MTGFHYDPVFAIAQPEAPAPPKRRRGVAKQLAQNEVGGGDNDATDGVAHAGEGGVAKGHREKASGEMCSLQYLFRMHAGWSEPRPTIAVRCNY